MKPLECNRCHGLLFERGDGLECSGCEAPMFGGMLDLMDHGTGIARCTRSTCGWRGPKPASTHCPKCEPELARPQTKRPPPPPRKRRRR